MSLNLNDCHFEGVMVVAYTKEDRVIGQDMEMPWPRLKKDMKRFRKITTGHPIIMGRRTFESIGKPLPKRTNIILTRNKEYEAEGCVVVHTIEAARKAAHDSGSGVYMVIGGGEIYRIFMPIVSLIHATEIHHSYKGNVTFPKLSHEWREVEREEHEGLDFVSYSRWRGIIT